MALNAKRAAFCREYLVDLNATQAAIRAGYAPKAAKQQGQRLLTFDDVRAEVQRLMGARAARTEITADAVLQELAKLGFADIRKLFAQGGQLIDVTRLPDDIAAAVQSVDVVVRPSAETDDDGNRAVEYVHKIRLADKRGSLELLGKHLKLFTEKVEAEVAVNPLPASVDEFV